MVICVVIPIGSHCNVIPLLGLCILMSTILTQYTLRSFLIRYHCLSSSHQRPLISNTPPLTDVSPHLLEWPHCPLLDIVLTQYGDIWKRLWIDYNVFLNHLKYTFNMESFRLTNFTCFLFVREVISSIYTYPTLVYFSTSCNDQ